MHHDMIDGHHSCMVVFDQQVQSFGKVWCAIGKLNGWFVSIAIYFVGLKIVVHS
jgi:hypothetical protein